MKTYRLYLHWYKNLRWLHRPQTDMYDTIVDDAGLVVVDGQAMRFADETLPAGTLVRVWFAGNDLTCAGVSEFEREIHEIRAREETWRKTFNATLALPVRWDVGIKDAHSGRNKATANHIRLCETLHEGRLQRQAGDFLCRSASGINGKRWSSRDAERAVDGDGNEYVPQ